MSETDKDKNKRTDEKEAVPTASLGAGTAGPGGQSGPYKLRSILDEGGLD